MKFCVTYVYWSLLLISVISSGVLFLIVASEGVKIEDSSSNNDEIHKVTNNFSIKVSNDALPETNNLFVSDLEISASIKTDDIDNVEKKTKSIPNDFQVPLGNDEPKKVEEIEVLAESLTQQPNLSQGISESGQSVVLTLVDTAASELQSLADPKIVSEFRARSLTNNLSLSNTAPRKEKEILGATTDPKPTVVISTERVNDSAIENTIPENKETVNLEEDSETVVVRAEKKSGVEESRVEENIKFEDEVLSKKEILKDADLNPAPELNESTTKSELVNGISDDSIPALLDGSATSESSDTQEDMPSFSEWAQKRLEEAEKKKTHPNVSVQNTGSPGKNVGGMKMRSKNYASPDCGAKIVASNPESRSARNVLVSTRDEYMLNTCTSRIWFVVELCEAIQAKKIELANFELFSSSPKDFTVLVSDRFPTRDWSSVGHFTAKDERDIQSFALQPQLFGKFIKIDLHSHYGSEHFCPISLFRTYGTSEFEVLETETEVQNPSSDDEDNENENGEEPLEFEGGESSRNLFGSARDAVLSIVRKAAEVLVKTGDLSRNNITKIQESIRGDLFQSSLASCATPRYAIVCKNCSDDRFARVFQLLSCRHRYLSALLDTSLIKNTLRDSQLCWTHSGKSEEDSSKSDICQARDLQATFLASFLTPDYIVALCNVLAAKDGKVLLNSSDEIAPIPDNGTLKEEILGSKEEKRDLSIENVQSKVTTSCSIDTSDSSCKPTINVQESRGRNLETLDRETETSTVTLSETSGSNEILASQIKPTKTLNQEEAKQESVVTVLEPSQDQFEESSHPEILTTSSPVVNAASSITKTQQDLSTQGESSGTVDNTVHISPTINNEQEKQDIQEKETIVKIQEVLNKSGDVKVEGQEQNKLDLGEEAKILTQEQMNFDSLLSDFKEFEGETVQNGQSGGSSAAQPTASSTPQQKESVFLRLSNRIKALERNMSLSGQYLEELSRRYKKQVEEMQRSLERATSAMNEESRKGEERDLKRMDEIVALREEIKFLSKSMESLLHDRDSWQSKLYYLGEHAILICINVILVCCIISYYRRSVDFEDEDREVTESTESNKISRRKATDFLKEKTVLPKKPKKRRPSEIANNISGTYEELMIEDQRIAASSRKEKKRKRRKEITLRVSNGDTKSSNIVRYKEVFNSPSSNLPSRRASSNESPSVSKQSVNLSNNRPDSAPENYADWANDNLSNRIEILSTPEEAGVTEEKNPPFQNEIYSFKNVTTISSNEEETETVKKGSKAESFKSKLSSPSFMKTALRSRSKRFSTSSSDQKSENSDRNKLFSSQESNSSLRIATEGHLNGSTANGYADQSDRSSSATPTSEKKEKKSTGLRKMVRKFF